MPEWVKVVFDGIGTQLFSIIISVLLGVTGAGLIVYKIIKKNNMKQVQKSCSNSKQIIGENITFYEGITEEKAREICTEVANKAIDEFSVIANNRANEKIQNFGNELISRIEKTETGLEIFSDPAFQVLLKRAQITAACSEREDDYKILSELLVHREKNKTNIKKKASIMKAVEIIDQIDDDSLCGLTVFHLLETIVPNTGDIKKGLEILSVIYEKLPLNDLPKDDLWIDNLAVLGAITTKQFSRLKEFDEVFFNKLPGYVCAGIKADGEEYQQIIKQAQDCGFDASIFFVKNELVNGYVRLDIKEIEDIDSFEMVKVNVQTGVKSIIQLTKEQKDCLYSAYNLYDKDKEILSEAKRNFSNLINQYSSLQTIKNWWNSINGSISITSVGRVIAHTYAKSIDNTLPDLD